MKNKLKLPKGVVHNPDLTLPDAIVFLAERMGSLEKAMMDLDAQATIRNNELERVSESVAYLGVQMSDLNENLYSTTQEMSFSDIMAALVIVLRRQTEMWAEVHRLDGYSSCDCGEEDED